MNCGLASHWWDERASHDEVEGRHTDFRLDRTGLLVRSSLRTASRCCEFVSAVHLGRSILSQERNIAMRSQVTFYLPVRLSVAAWVLEPTLHQEAPPFASLPQAVQRMNRLSSGPTFGGVSMSTGLPSQNAAPDPPTHMQLCCRSNCVRSGTGMHPDRGDLPLSARSRRA